MDLTKFKKSPTQNVLQDRPFKTQKNKTGRPTKETSEKLSCKITFNFTEDERETLRKKAKEQGVPVTTLVRSLLKKHDCI